MAKMSGNIDLCPDGTIVPNKILLVGHFLGTKLLSLTGKSF